MTPDALRQQCEAFLSEPPMSLPISEEPECVEALVKFARALKVETWRESVKLIHVMAIKEGFSNISKTDEESDMRKATAWMMDQCAAACENKAKEIEA